jgi:hypothetical protein
MPMVSEPMFMAELLLRWKLFRHYSNVFTGNNNYRVTQTLQALGQSKANGAGK